ncbi:MAG: shikimate kinase, partial [Betaproteobacteria bacterium]
MIQPGPIALIGLPGGGKSTVGRHLARSLGVPFFDTDHEIERRVGTSIRDFFAAEGEQAFRDVELEVISEVLGSTEGGVIATGGGAVLREANRRAL